MTNTEPKVSEIQSYLAFAKSMIEETRALIRERARKGFGVETKSDASPVTDADREAELLIRKRVSESYPTHGVLGEEFPPANPDADYQWITDPIDGTMNFVSGIPTFGTILGLHHKGRPIVGIIDHPLLELFYSAALGLGSFCNSERLLIKDDGEGLSPGRTVVSLAGRSNFRRVGQEALFDRFMLQHPNIRLYCDCFSHTRAAHGQLGASVSFAQREWDIAATEILVTEAGGEFVDVLCSEPKPGIRYRSVIFGKRSVVSDLLPFFVPAQ